ncbi:hypothetical protein Q6242_27040, partial [Klebsiella pneumoniae]|nr:hypothetical protein [Klebsiella pneumoniae]
MNSLCGELSIKGLQAVSNREEAHRAHLERKEFLKALKLEWEPSLQLQEPSESSHEQVLEGLKPPCKIEELHIRQ